MDPRGEYLGNYRCADSCQKLNTSTKAVYLTQLSDALILQLNTFKYIADISRKFIDKKISLWEQEWYFLLLYITKENNLIADITYQELDNIWFLISDTNTLRL